MKITAHRLKAVMAEKAIKKSLVSKKMLCQIGQRDFVSFQELAELKTHLHDLAIYFNQLNEDTFFAIDLGYVARFGHLKLSQQQLDELLDIQHENMGITPSNQRSASALPIDEVLLNIWIKLSELAPQDKTITFKALTHKMQSGHHLTTKKLLRHIADFCTRKKIPDITLLVVKASNGLPNNKIMRDAWLRECEKIASFDYHTWEDVFLKSFEVDLQE
ncbi:hypothetical protein [Paralysiella testudinis]|uniref:Uncharacterized protein n=1 Tax=Paralysiella testudinis TaxID=2809020 RepID=A0A892ZH09_9NEIS|nr:hypothetical protein [Paralysiella testudinis]QRQ80854.1 hypothetical protein JQU52_08825 [Paralysiella testudinis]